MPLALDVGDICMAPYTDPEGTSGYVFLNAPEGVLARKHTIISLLLARILSTKRIFLSVSTERSTAG